MSILLNALNKSNSEQESAEALDKLIDETGNESEQTADSDVHDVSDQYENQKKQGAPTASSFNMMAVMFGFLSLIVILLLVIVFLLLQQGDSSTAQITKQQNPAQQLSQDSQQTQSSPLNSSAEDIISDNQSSVSNSSISKSSDNKPEILLTENPVSDKSTGTQQENSASSNTEQSLATTNDHYFESFKPEKQAVKRITKTESSHVNSLAEISGDKKNYNEQLTNQTTSVANSSAAESSTSSSEHPTINKALPIKEFDQLTQIEQLMVNEITLDAHVYSEQASQRFIFMNDALIQEGEKIINSWYLESIEPDGIVVNNGVLRVNIEKQ